MLNLLGYQIRVLKYLPHAIPNANGEYMAHKMWGNTNAAQLSILKMGKSWWIVHGLVQEISCFLGVVLW